MLVGRLKGKVMDKLGVRVEEYILKLRDDVDNFDSRYEKTGGNAIGKTIKRSKIKESEIPIGDRLALGSNKSVLYTYN